MNTKLSNLAVLIALLGSIAERAMAQGTFGNLNFESTRFVPIPPDGGDPRVEFGAAVPGWTGYIDGQIQTAMFPNYVPLGPTPIPFISVLTPPTFGMVLEGNYTLAYGSGFDAMGNFVPVALAQTGQVPSDGLSLRFLAAYRPAMFVDGNSVLPVALASGPSLTTLYGVDVSAFAGLTVELRFEPATGLNYLDAIQFSDQPIPEPSTFGLFCLGALFLGWQLLKIPREK